MSFTTFPNTSDHPWLSLFMTRFPQIQRTYINYPNMTEISIISWKQWPTYSLVKNYRLTEKLPYTTTWEIWVASTLQSSHSKIWSSITNSKHQIIGMSTYNVTYTNRAYQKKGAKDRPMMRHYINLLNNLNFKRNVWWLKQIYTWNIHNAKACAREIIINMQMIYAKNSFCS